MKPTRGRTSLFLMAALLAVLATTTPLTLQAQPPRGTLPALIPQPVQVVRNEGVFWLEPRRVIYIEGRNPAQTRELRRIARYLADRLESLSLSVEEGVSGRVGPGHILLTTGVPGAPAGSESYTLDVRATGIVLGASEPEGIFRGIQTLRQLLPPECEGRASAGPGWALPLCRISDAPRYRWRGMMLDVARHFHGVESVKRLIDLLALYKVNVLHLHLTDDQGWRIEIKKWPDLTRIGGSRAIGGGPGGFYTQDDYRRIVAYARERYITIVPEIDMPGHTNAALASYGELNPDGRRKKFRFDRAVGYSTLMCRSEITYRFVADVIGEVAALTPGKYFHIGGDESRSTSLEDYRYFVERVSRIVAASGKTMIGWQENIAAATVPDSGVVAQYWDGALPGNRAMIVSTAKKAYLDMKYENDSPFGLDWAGKIPVRVGYDWDPDTYTQGGDCYGIEAPLWTETVATMTDIEFMAFPRILGYAEIGWTPKQLRNWDEYKHRLGRHWRRLTSLNVNFYEDPAVPWEDGKVLQSLNNCTEIFTSRPHDCYICY